MAANDEEFTLNVDEFMVAMDLYQRATGHTTAKIVNRKGGRACVAAGRIIKSAKKASINKHKLLKRKNKYQNRLFYALAVKYKGGKKGAGIRAKAEAIKAKRISSVGYSKALFFTMAKAFGEDLSKKFEVENVEVIPATPGKDYATLKSNDLDITLRDTVLMPAFEAGLRKEAAATNKWAQNKLDRDAAKYSAR